MKKFAAALGIALLFLNLAWGGTAPIGSGWGMDDGTTDTIPAGMSRFHWYAYSGGLDDDTWDEVSLAVATLDHESPVFRFVPDDPAHPALPLGEVRVSVSIKRSTDALPTACTDNDSSTKCTLGTTTCLSDTTTGSFDLCHHYRVELWWNRILYRDSNPTYNQALQDLYAITRHELTHVLGFTHPGTIYSGGPMTNGNFPLTECQLAAIELYDSDPSGSTWIYSVPEECD